MTGYETSPVRTWSHTFHGDGTTSTFECHHNLDSREVLVAVFNADNQSLLPPPATFFDSNNTLTLLFAELVLDTDTGSLTEIEIPPKDGDVINVVILSA